MIVHILAVVLLFSASSQLVIANEADQEMALKKITDIATNCWVQNQMIPRQHSVLLFAINNEISKDLNDFKSKEVRYEHSVTLRKNLVNAHQVHIVQSNWNDISPDIEKPGYSKSTKSYLINLKCKDGVNCFKTKTYVTHEEFNGVGKNSSVPIVENQTNSKVFTGSVSEHTLHLCTNGEVHRMVNALKVLVQ